MGKNLRYYLYLCLAATLTACQGIINYPVNGFTPTINPLNTAEFPFSLTATSAQTPLAPTVTLANTSTPIKPSATRTPTFTPTATDLPLIMCSPLKDETIKSLAEIVSNPYNPPLPGKDDHHHGVDFSYYRRGTQLTIEGEPIQSILPGTVSSSIQNRQPYGNMVIIETPHKIIPKGIIDKFDLEIGESLYSLYAHMGQSPLVRLGENVTCGQILGVVGKTGYYIVNAHLHLETRVGPSGARFEAMAFYDTGATVEEMDNYLLWRTSGEFVTLDPMQVFEAYLTETSLENQTPMP